MLLVTFLLIVLSIAFIVFCLKTAAKQMKQRREQKSGAAGPADYVYSQYGPGGQKEHQFNPNTAPEYTVRPIEGDPKYVGTIKINNTWIPFEKNGFIDTCCVCHKQVYKDDRFYARCVNCKGIACKDCHYWCPFCGVARCDDCARLGHFDGHDDVICPNVSWHGPMQRQL